MDNQRGNIEVSLPGAGESEPTILEVINNRNTITNKSETEIQDETETTSSSSQPQLEEENTSYQQETEKINVIPNTDEPNKTITTEELHKIAKDTLGNINLNNNNKNLENIVSPPGNILNIESHLIETFENFSVSETSDNGGVVIKECQPAKEEFRKSSQIETETSPKTIIEIEPSIPKIFKPIELDLDLNIKKQFGVETTEIINNNTKPAGDSVKTESEASEQIEHQDKSLNSHIEKNTNNKSENLCGDLNEKEDLIKDNDSINLNIGIGINGLQNCITELEEEEKKKLLDSLPQLDENDSNNLSIQAKKEYYQLLRDYLDKHQDDRPPVPIQTYRWEDLRRAKEKGGYPWTHLYKRPLGPDEEPEIVLLLRKSQEFRFSSESPRSLKKVRIHDQVLVKETERYINDLSDTEDNPEIIAEDNIKNIEDNHSINSESASVSLTSDSLPKKSKLSKLKGILKRNSSTNEIKLNSPNKSGNKKTETTTNSEDNNSLHSESAISGISDSVCEDKKSKFNKLKGLVKRQSGDVKNKKPKESASIFYSVSTEDTTSPEECNQTVSNESETKKSKFDKFIDIVKGGKNSSQSKEQTGIDNHSIHSESAIFGLSDSEGKQSKFSKLKGFVKRRSGDKKQEDTKSVQSESAVPSKSDSALPDKKSKLRKLQGAFKFQKDIEKKEENLKKTESSETSPSNEDTQSESGLSETVPESKKLTFNKLQGLIKIKTNKKDESTQEDTVSSKSDSTLVRKKFKISNLKNFLKGQPSDTENSKAKELEKPTTEIIDPTSPVSQSEDKLKTGDKKSETTQEDAISSKSDSTLERKKSKLSNLKRIFKGQPDTENKKAEEFENPTTEINDTPSPDSHTEDTQSIQSETESSAPVPKIKTTKLKKLKGIVKRRSAAKKPRSKKVISTSSAIEENSTEVLKSKSEDSPKKKKCCHPVMDKLKILTDKQFKKRNIKKVALKDEEKIILEEQQKILKLRESPKAVRGEIPKFVEKQDSEDLLEIVQLEESPSQKRKDPTSSILIPDEIIELPSHTLKVQERQQNIDPSITPEPTISEILEDELKSTTPPKKTIRKMKTHIYEDIENNEPTTIEMTIDEILQLASVEALKKSLAAQDQIILKDMESNKKIPLDRMGSSEEEIEKTTTRSLNGINHLAPISSIDSASSDEQEKRIQLSSVAEESDVCSTDGKDVIVIEENQFELDVKSSLKRESSPSLSIGADKKVTFSHVEDDAEPHREDIEIPEELKGMPNRWSTMNDHEYEPIGEPQETTSILKKEVSPDPQTVSAPKSTDDQQQIDGIQQAEELQRDLEDRYFTSSNGTTSGTESRTDYDIHTNQVDSSALEELPIKGANSKKSFISTAQDRSRKLKAGIRSQAGKVRTKFRRTKKQQSNVSGDSPKATKEKRKFKAPEFSKIKMPDIPKFKSPDMSKFKKPEFKKIEFKRPEFTKFNKPDMSKFKIPEKFTSLKLKRSKSFKEEEIAATSIQTGESGTTPESAATPSKKKFEFNFGTYPRALRRKKVKDSIEDISRVNEVSTVPSTETPPSIKLTTVLRGTRAEGPVGSRWQDKFSDVSFGDSESGRFQRYGSEVESFDRESSMERRMKDDLVAQDENELGPIGSVEHKQFADYDEENRAIHEISKIREGEFKQRRPMIHQDSNISEESKDVGWTDKDAMRNKILRHSDMENEGYNNKYASEDALTGSMNTNHETQSTGSSGAKKGVIEEIDDDEFFLRKRGISQDNIEIRQYISSAIREGFDNPVNSLAQLGNTHDEYPDSMLGSSQDQGDFGYDMPPVKPRRIKNYNNFNRNTESQEISQGYDEEQKENYDDNISLPQTGSDYFQNIQPNRPLRKSKKGYSQDSQSDIQNVPYFDDIEKEIYHKELNLENADENLEKFKNVQPPKPPKRRKKENRESVEKDLFINGFGGRSVSNTFLQNDNESEDVIVFRTEHAYVIPLAQPESSITPAASIQRSRSGIHKDEDDRSSLGGDSFTSDIMQAVEEESSQKFTIEMKANDGYAVVRKEPPPRPPPPSRRKRHTQPTGNFATMPHPAKETPPPQRPKKYYSTIGPSRPPRRKTSFGSADLQKSASDITQYEEVEDQIIEQAELQKDLQSGDVIKKMKYRPLPPPPPPPRGKKKYQYGGDDDRFNDDHDGGGEKMSSDIQMNGNYDIEKVIEKCIEVEVSTQTDPLPDDFVCEDFEITDDMKVIEPRNSKTLEDFLREDQGNDLDFNNSTTEENLTRGIQRFRDANQKSFSEKSKNSSAADRSRSHSRPHTPSAIVIEKRVPTPVPNNASETMLQASLTVQPIDDDLESDEHFGEDYPSSTSYQASTVKSVGSHESGDCEKERLNDFIEEERRLRQQEEDRRIMDEIRQREEEEEQEIMKKIRELQRLEEEEERKTIEKLRELQIEEDNMKKYETEEQREENERQRREEEDRRVMEKIRELERQEEEDRKIMEKIRQLEREFADSSEKSPEIESYFKPEERDYERMTTESPKPNVETYPDPEIELIEAEMSPPPNPPPRKRSSTNILPEDRIITPTVESSSLSPVIENSLPIAETTESNSSVLPNRMAVADLEVERLRVHALQAGHIMVSSLHGTQIGADQLECKSGNLVVRNLELPPGFIEEIVERVRTSERSHIPVETQTIDSGDNKVFESQTQHVQLDQPPERPPLPQQPIFPSEYMHSIPPASFYQLRDPTEVDYQPNMQAPRRRRHHRRRDSSSEDSHRHRNHGTRSPEPTVAQLGGQLLQACGTSLLRSMNQVANYVRTSQKVEGGERNIGTLIAIFILMTLGFLFIGMSGKNIHHHHWDYFNPPGNDGRQQQ